MELTLVSVILQSLLTALLGVAAVLLRGVSKKLDDVAEVSSHNQVAIGAVLQKLDDLAGRIERLERQEDAG